MILTVGPGRQYEDTELTTALAEAAPGDTILVYHGGNYELYQSSYVVDKDLTIKGMGPAPTYIRCYDSDAQPAFVVRQASVTFEWLHLDARATQLGLGSHSVQLDGTGVEDIRFNRCILDGDGLSIIDDDASTGYNTLQIRQCRVLHDIDIQQPVAGSFTIEACEYVEEGMYVGTTVPDTEEYVITPTAGYGHTYGSMLVTDGAPVPVTPTELAVTYPEGGITWRWHDYVDPWREYCLEYLVGDTKTVYHRPEASGDYYTLEHPDTALVPNAYYQIRVTGYNQSGVSDSLDFSGHYSMCEYPGPPFLMHWSGDYTGCLLGGVNNPAGTEYLLAEQTNGFLDPRTGEFQSGPVWLPREDIHFSTFNITDVPAEDGLYFQATTRNADQVEAPYSETFVYPLPPVAPYMADPVVHDAHTVTWIWEDRSKSEGSYELEYLTGGLSRETGILRNSTGFTSRGLQPNYPYQTQAIAIGTGWIGDILHVGEGWEYATFDDAYNAAQDGDVIVVHDPDNSQTWTVQSVIAKELYIIGEGPSPVHLHGQSASGSRNIDINAPGKVVHFEWVGISIDYWNRAATRITAAHSVIFRRSGLVRDSSEGWPDALYDPGDEANCQLALSSRCQHEPSIYTDDYGNTSSTSDDVYGYTAGTQWVTWDRQEIPALNTTTVTYTECVTPNAPTLANNQDGTLDLSVTDDPNHSDTEYVLRCDRYGYLDESGNFTQTPVWQTQTQWGALHVTISDEGTFQFDAKARNQDLIETAWSGQTGYSAPPLAPVILTPEVQGPRSIRWVWDDQSLQEDEYHLEYTSGNAQNSPTLGPNVEWWTDADLQPNVQYSAQVRATNFYGSRYSSVETVYTYASPPASPLQGSVGLNWMDLTPRRGANPAGTDLALYNLTDETYIDESGNMAADPVWLSEAQWGTVTVTQLTQSTEYEFVCYARNQDGIVSQPGTVGTYTTLSGISGIVTEDDMPVSRLVRLYVRSTGELYAETWSAADGTYTIKVPNAVTEYVVVALDNLGEDPFYNADVLDLIQGT